MPSIDEIEDAIWYYLIQYNDEEVFGPGGPTGTGQAYVMAKVDDSLPRDIAKDSGLPVEAIAEYLGDDEVVIAYSGEAGQRYVETGSYDEWRRFADALEEAMEEFEDF